MFKPQPWGPVGKLTDFQIGAKHENKIQGEVRNAKQYEKHLLSAPIFFVIFFAVNPHPMLQDVCADN